MIPFSIKEHKLSGECSVTDVNLPNTWEELTIKQFSEFITADPDDFCMQLAILSGVDREIFFAAEMDAVTLQQVYSCLEFLRDHSIRDLPVPDSITIDRKVVEVPKDLASLSFGQRLTFERRAMEKKNSEDGESVIVSAKPGYYADALAVYLKPIFEGKEKFSDVNMESFVKKCGKVKLTEGLPVAAFFLNKFFGLSPRNPKLVIPSTTNTSKQDLPASTGTAT